MTVVVWSLEGSNNVWISPEHSGVFCADRGWPQALQVCFDSHNNVAVCLLRLKRWLRGRKSGGKVASGANQLLLLEVYFVWQDLVFVLQTLNAKLSIPKICWGSIV